MPTHAVILRRLAVLCTVPLTAGVLAAQGPAQQRALLAFQDTTAAATTVDAVNALEEKSQRGSVALVREGLRELRLAELGTGRGGFDDALMTIDRGLQADEKSAYGWYATGLTRLAMWDRKFPSKATPRQGAGQSYRRAAIDAFARAIGNDSTFLPASEAMATLVTAMGHRLLPPELLPPLRQVAQVQGVSPEVHLAISRLEFGAKRYDASLTALGDYLRQGGDSAMARLEQARALFALGRSDEALKTYLAVPASPGEVGRAAYRGDLAWIAYDWEISQFDSLPGAAVSGWLTRFFRDRDALALRGPNERLTEHLRRWVFVHENFLIHRPEDAPIHSEGLTDLDQASLFDDDAVDDVMTEVAFGVPRFTTYVRTQWEIDDRGVIYLRHGEPAKKASSVAGPPNESWSYYLPEGIRVFHFLGSRALGTTAGTTLVAALPMNAEILDARSDLDMSYAKVAAELRNLQAATATNRSRASLMRRNLGSPNSPGGNPLPVMGGRLHANTLQREIDKNRKAIAAGVSTDGFPLVFKQSLDAVVQVYGVGFGTGETKRVLAVFAVPGRNLVPQPRPDGGPGLLYPIVIRLIAMDRAGGQIRQLDTTRVFLSRDTLRGEQHLTGTVELAVPPGMYQIRALLTSPGAEGGASAGRDSIQIPATTRDLMLSDVILGREGAITWTYAGTKIPLNPLNAFPRGSDAEMFYEVGGLIKGNSYEVSIAVRKPDDKATSKPLSEVSFTFDAEAEYQRVTRGIGLQQVKPGQYLLQVTVKEKGSDRSITRLRALNVLEK